MATITFAEIHARLAQAPEAGPVVTPKGAAFATLSRLRRQLAALPTADRDDVCVLLIQLVANGSELDSAYTSQEG